MNAVEPDRYEKLLSRVCEGMRGGAAKREKATRGDNSGGFLPVVQGRDFLGDALWRYPSEWLSFC